MARRPIRVLIVDDSVVVRGVLSRVLSKDPDLEVIGAATDPYEAREKIVALKPDVITLDIEMPKMDGLTFLSKIMTHMPLPVVMCSSVTREGADLTLKAMELGAVDVVSKPSSTQVDGLHDVAIELVDKIKAAARASVPRVRRTPPPGTTDERGRPLGVTAVLGRVRGQNYVSGNVITPPAALTRNQHRIIAVGSSTGGTEALRVILERLPVQTPGMLVVQHMPEHFTLAFANRLNSLVPMEVKEAENGDEVGPGRVLIAQGNRHLMLRRSGVKMVAEVRDGPLVCRHRPSVEVLFQSVARVAGPSTVGVMLTGMGNDGANGMALLRQSGSYNIAQDEASSVVFGMPKEAIKCGAVDRVEHLERIAQAIIDACCR